MMSRKIALLACATGLMMGSVAQASTPRTTFVHLFEWKWEDVAKECETFLGPKGFSAVQVSPPNKTIDGGQWWTRYQPVAYYFDGRSGNRGQFQDMVNRCKAVGVDIYVDAVINHMAAWNRSFPEVPYGPNDFHHCTSKIDYGNRWQIQNCDLSGLNDLATESDYVRQKIADYMNDAISMGVAGFRIDAAKHMPAGDINAIKNKLNGNPYIFQEVIGAYGEPVRPTEYTYNGDVTEFDFARRVGPAFRNSNIASLRNIGNELELSSSNAVTFVTNHDEERHNPNGPIWHGVQGDGYFLANIFMLAYPYGYPKIMSGYYFNGDFDMGPPSSGVHTGNACGFDGGSWVCEHKWRGIANMVAFRNHTADKWQLTDWWQNGNDQIGFGRAGNGYVVINKRYGSDLNQRLFTGMPDNVYCNVIEANFNEQTGECIGAPGAKGPTTITVSGGYADFNVSGDNAAAIHVGAIVGKNCPGCTVPTPDPEQPVPGLDGKAICYDNKGGFSNPHIYYWGAQPGNAMESVAWPGKAMYQHGPYYCFDVNEQLTSMNVIFSDNGANQTQDLTASSDKFCHKNGTWMTMEECGFGNGDDDGGDEEWFFRGTPNGWGVMQLDYDSSTGNYYTIQKFNGEEQPARFKIDNGSWTESYPAQDYRVDDYSTYRITFNSETKSVSVTKQ
ncbi:starch-binding protein [Vibrio agarilyticus]|nr:starch-binding protein [Vibrio agarilyticus]